MADYCFVTSWQVDAALADVWEEIAHPLRWPEWWRGVEDVVQLEPGDDDGLGSLYRYTWRSILPYRLRFAMRTTVVERHRLIEGVADGELQGVGRWTIAPRARGTAVRYDWTVDATKRWMRVLAPAARPLFEWNHDVVMRWGEQGLSARLARAQALVNAPGR